MAVIFPLCIAMCSTTECIAVCSTTECPPYKKKENNRYQIQIRRTFVIFNRRPG